MLVSPRITSISRLRGFTLVELLTVVAVVGVLAAIMIPAVAMVKTKSSSAQCAGQIRHIGSALQMYLQDNNNILPTSHLGTPFSGQGPFYNRDPRRIQTLYGQYLDIPKARSWSTSEEKMSFDSSMSWPAWEDSRRGPSPSLIGNLPIKLTTDPTKYVKPPWGQSYLLIDNPSDAPMYTEADFAVAPSAGWAKFMPEEPVHGSYRNTVFYDGHVEQVDVSVDLRNP